jgi:nicotinamidase-related amidase
MAAESPFWRSVDMSKTALLLSDVQTQLFAHIPDAEQEKYLTYILGLLRGFREYQAKARASNGEAQSPLIIHHVVSMDFATINLSPYNKINNWAMKRLQTAGVTPKPVSDPATTVPPSLHPEAGWSLDEFVLTKQAPSCFMSSSLLKILGARGIKHVVLIGLTTEGSILSSVRHGADLDFHIIVPNEGVWCDDAELGETILGKLVPRFADVVALEDIASLL